MKRVQRSPWIAAGLAVLAGTALADVSSIGEPRRVLEDAPADLGYVSNECRQFLFLPADSTSRDLRWAQRMSLASCRDTIAIPPVSDAEALPELVTALENHAAPTLGLYREVIGRAPATARILATYALGMTYLDIAVRARGAVRVADTYGGPTYGNAAYFQELRRLHDALEPLLVGDLRAARAAFEEVGFLAEDFPIPAHANELVVHVVRSARAQAQLLR